MQRVKSPYTSEAQTSRGNSEPLVTNPTTWRWTFAVSFCVPDLHNVSVDLIVMRIRVLSLFRRRLRRNPKWMLPMFAMHILAMPPICIHSTTQQLSASVKKRSTRKSVLRAPAKMSLYMPQRHQWSSATKRLPQISVEATGEGGPWLAGGVWGLEAFAERTSGRMTLRELCDHLEVSDGNRSRLRRQTPMLRADWPMLDIRIVM